MAEDNARSLFEKVPAFDGANVPDFLSNCIRAAKTMISEITEFEGVQMGQAVPFFTAAELAVEVNSNTPYVTPVLEPTLPIAQGNSAQMHLQNKQSRDNVFKFRKDELWVKAQFISKVGIERLAGLQQGPFASLDHVTILEMIAHIRVVTVAQFSSIVRNCKDAMSNPTLIQDPKQLSELEARVGKSTRHLDGIGYVMSPAEIMELVLNAVKGNEHLENGINQYLQNNQPQARTVTAFIMALRSALAAHNELHPVENYGLSATSHNTKSTAEHIASLQAQILQLQKGQSGKNQKQENKKSVPSATEYCWTHGPCMHASKDCKEPGKKHVKNANMHDTKDGNPFDKSGPNDEWRLCKEWVAKSK